MNKKFKKKIIGTSSFSFRLLLGLCFLFPILIGFLYSFAPDVLLDAGAPSVVSVLKYFTLENYDNIFSSIPVFRYITNSLAMCAVVIIVQIIVSSLAAYAFAMFNFPGKNILFTIVQIAMMIPGQVVTIANFLTIQEWGLVNSFISLCLPSLIFGSSIFMMRQFFLQLPKDLKDASLIDGCSDMRFLFSIALPLAKPTIASLSIHLFMEIFNSYFWPLLVARDQKNYTIQIGMSMLVDADATQFGRILAGAIISIIIPVIAFIIGQGYLIKGMTNGAVKG